MSDPDKLIQAIGETFHEELKKKKLPGFARVIFILAIIAVCCLFYYLL
jgi:hypothetical protein